MKKKTLLGTTLLSALLITNFTNFNAFAENQEKNNENQEISSESSMPTYYDENNVEIKPQTEEEFQKMQMEVIKNNNTNQEISLMSALYPTKFDDFGKTTFTNFVWVRNQKVYKNPSYLNMERGNRISGLAVYFYDSANSYQGKVVFPKTGNIWVVATADHLKRGKSYKFKLVSEKGEKSIISQGNIGYM